MGVMDKFLNAMKLNDDDDYYDDDYYDDEPVEEKPKKLTGTNKETVQEPVEDKQAVKKTVPKVTPLRQNKKTGNGMEVCVIKPVSIEDAKEITDTLRCGRAVVLNLEGLDIDVAQRIIDFASGSSYAIDGKLQKISNHIFILTPKTVDISGDFQDVMTGSKLEGSALKTPLR